MAHVKSEKLWSDAVRKAVHEYQISEDPKGKVKKTRYLNLLAKTLVENGVKGDMQAIREIGDRLDGKPNQPLEHKGNTNITPVVNVTIHGDDRPGPAPEAGNGATVTSH